MLLASQIYRDVNYITVTKIVKIVLQLSFYDAKDEFACVLQHPLNGTEHHKGLLRPNEYNVQYDEATVLLHYTCHPPVALRQWPHQHVGFLS